MDGFLALFRLRPDLRFEVRGWLAGSRYAIRTGCLIEISPAMARLIDGAQNLDELVYLLMNIPLEEHGETEADEE